MDHWQHSPALQPRKLLEPLWAHDASAEIELHVVVPEHSFAVHNAVARVERVTTPARREELWRLELDGLFAVRVKFARNQIERSTTLLGVACLLIGVECRVN